MTACGPASSTGINKQPYRALRAKQRPRRSKETKFPRHIKDVRSETSEPSARGQLHQRDDVASQ
eukprot:scaffold3271_cov60-Phaeocystis_antarctica.AAC.5